MSEAANKVYARVVCGEIVADCEAPSQYASNGDLAIKMLNECAQRVIEIIKAQEPKEPKP